jgi:hypothetical protein
MGRLRCALPYGAAALRAPYGAAAARPYGDCNCNCNYNYNYNHSCRLLP